MTSLLRSVLDLPGRTLRPAGAATLLGVLTITATVAGCSDDSSTSTDGDAAGAQAGSGEAGTGETGGGEAGGGGAASDLTAPSTDAAETVYRYVQLMAAGDVEAACGLVKESDNGTAVVASSTAETLAECLDSPPGSYNIEGPVTWEAAAQLPREGYSATSDSSDEAQMEVALTTVEPDATTFSDLQFELVHVEDPADGTWYVT